MRPTRPAAYAIAGLFLACLPAQDLSRSVADAFAALQAEVTVDDGGVEAAGRLDIARRTAREVMHQAGLQFGYVVDIDDVDIGDHALAQKTAVDQAQSRAPDRRSCVR